MRTSPENVAPVATTVSEHRVIVTIVNPAYLSQRAAAAYLGVSTRYFRDHVAVRPKELPGSGNRPVLRWAVADLVAWVEHVSNPKSRLSRPRRRQSTTRT